MPIQDNVSETTLEVLDIDVGTIHTVNNWLSSVLRTKQESSIHCGVLPHIAHYSLGTLNLIPV
jgi:hypothetical protein